MNTTHSISSAEGIMDAIKELVLYIAASGTIVVVLHFVDRLWL